MSKRALIMAGGTGGHVFPALALARELTDHGFQVDWLGARTGIENRLVPAAGLTLHTLSVSGVRGNGVKRLLGAPLMLTRAVLSAWRLTRHLRPSVAVGFGGFASGPGGIAARLAGVPLVIHEQNAVPGMTNRILSRFAARVLEAFSGAFPDETGAVAVGNPVRREILELPNPSRRYGERQGPLRILVTGGSQGAQVFNTTLPRLLAAHFAQAPEIRHQAGQGRISEADAAYEQAGLKANVSEFIDDMAEAYGWADLVICRAGALTVSEVAAAGVAALFVPLPWAVDDHQTLNARWLADQRAARLLPQPELDEEGLRRSLRGMDDRESLALMAGRARQQAIPDSAVRMREICEEVAHD